MHGEGARATVLGLGRIGSRLARQLLAANYDVRGWNRTPRKPNDFSGIKLSGMPAEAVEGADFVLVSLFNDAAVEDVLFHLGTAEAIKPGAVVIDMSSIRPEVAREHARRLAKRDVGHVDAPITGGVIGADSGTLLIMAGGEGTDVAKAAPLLQNFGRMIHVGASGAGQFAKIANQILMGATAAAIAEAILLAERHNIDPNRILDAIRGGLAHSRAVELYARRIISRNFESRGAGSSIQLKDLDNALAEAGSKKLELPLTRQIRDLYTSMLDSYGDLDKSAVYLRLSGAAVTDDTTRKARRGTN